MRCIRIGHSKRRTTGKPAQSQVSSAAAQRTLRTCARMTTSARRAPPRVPNCAALAAQLRSLDRAAEHLLVGAALARRRPHAVCADLDRGRGERRGRPMMRGAPTRARPAAGDPMDSNRRARRSPAQLRGVLIDRDGWGLARDAVMTILRALTLGMIAIATGACSREARAPDGPAASDAASDSPTQADAPTPDALAITCGAVTCDAATEICVVRTPVGPSQSYTCEPVPPDCAGDHSCACVHKTLCTGSYSTCTDPSDPDTIVCECTQCQ